MNCSYHSQNPANVSCNGCGRPLCPACDHRIKGFPYCQDCIVNGIDLLRQQSRGDNAPFVKKRTSPVIALFLSAICPGLGAAYNGQMVKALVYFGVFIGLFQLAVLSAGIGTPLFVLGFIGMWFFAALDAWRTAQMIRAGLTPDVADDILVRRFSGNPKMWGLILAGLGGLFLLQTIVPLRGLIRGLLPLMLIVLGVYLLRGHIFKSRKAEPAWPENANPSFAIANTRYNQTEDRSSGDFSDRSRTGTWRDS